MECLRWEELDKDCLSNIFSRLAIDDLSVAVPFVCKSRHRGSLNPLCWRVLDFRSLDFMPRNDFTKKFVARYPPSRFSFSRFMRFAVGRSAGDAVELSFPVLLGSVEDLEFASNECTRLKTLLLPNLTLVDEVRIAEIVGKLKYLERLEMESKPSSFTKIAATINTNCTNFVALKMHGAIMEEDAHALVKFMPKLNRLDLSKSYLPKKNLIVIMKGCTELERLSVRDCIGFEADEEILKRSNRIKTFEHQGSQLSDDNWYGIEDEDQIIG